MHLSLPGPASDMFGFVPSSFPRNTPIPGIPGGMSHIPSSSSTLDRVLMNGTKQFDAGTYNAGAQSNNFVNHSHRIMQSDTEPGRNMLDDLDYAMPHFACVPDHIMNKYSANLQANLSDMPQKMKSLSSMNHWLQSEVGRVQYGGDKDCQRLFKDWKYVGCLQTQPTEDTKIRNELKAAFTKGKRVRLPDFFAATGRLINQGDYLHLICVRRSLDEENGELPADDGKAKADEIPRFYWQFQPWIAPAGMSPPSEAYTTHEFNGDKVYIGKVFTVETPIMNIDTHKVIARRAIFPNYSDPDIHRKDLSALPQFEMQASIR